VKSKTSKSSAFKAKSKKFKMILYTTVSYISLHSLTAISTIYGKFHDSHKIWYFFNSFEGNAVLLAYLVPFFIYIHFNNIFRKRFLSLINYRSVF
jgi:hypothetical protein